MTSNIFSAALYFLLSFLCYKLHIREGNDYFLYLAMTLQVHIKTELNIQQTGMEADVGHQQKGMEADVGYNQPTGWKMVLDMMQRTGIEAKTELMQARPPVWFSFDSGELKFG